MIERDLSFSGMVWFESELFKVNSTYAYYVVHAGKKKHEQKYRERDWNWDGGKVF